MRAVNFKPRDSKFCTKYFRTYTHIFRTTRDNISKEVHFRPTLIDNHFREDITQVIIDQSENIVQTKKYINFKICLIILPENYSVLN